MTLKLSNEIIVLGVPPNSLPLTITISFKCSLNVCLASSLFLIGGVSDMLALDW